MPVPATTRAETRADSRVTFCSPYRYTTMKHLSGITAVALWALAASALLFGMIHHDLEAYAVANFLGLASLGATTWVMSERRERIREHTIDDVADVVDALYTAQGNIHRLR